jgi:hypothetical protein
LIVHAVFAANVAVATVNTTFAATWPEEPTTVVKVLVPQPTVVGAAVPESVQLGSVSVIASLTASAALHLKAKATVEAAPARGLAMANDAPEKAGASIAVEMGIGIAAKLPLAAIRATVRVLKLAFCAAVAHVAPDAHVNEQTVLAARVAAFAVKTTLAQSSPDEKTMVEKVVVLHPDVLGAVVPESVHPGKTIVIVSPMAMLPGATKLYVTDVAEPRMGVAMTRVLSARPTTTASDVTIEAAGASAEFAMVAAIVYPELSAVTAPLFVVMVAAFVVMVHAVFAARALVATVKATFAAASPEEVTAVVKAASPQPVVLGAAVPVSV